MLKPHSDISGKTTARHDPEDSLSPRRSRFTSLFVFLLSLSPVLSLRVRADARRSVDSHFLWGKIFLTLTHEPVHTTVSRSSCAAGSSTGCLSMRDANSEFPASRAQSLGVFPWKGQCDINGTTDLWLYTTISHTMWENKEETNRFSLGSSFCWGKLRPPANVCTPPHAAEMLLCAVRCRLWKKGNEDKWKMPAYTTDTQINTSNHSYIRVSVS